MPNVFHKPLRFIRFNPLPHRVVQLMAEFIGTFFFILSISMCIQQTNIVGQLAPVGIGFMLCSVVFAYGYLSGAVFNPAIAIGLYVLEQISGRRLIMYICAQMSGGLAAAFLSWFLVGHSENVVNPAPVPRTDDAIDIGRSLVAEAVLTFGFMSVVLNVACSQQKDNEHYGLGIGFFLAAAAFCIGGISGGAFNPAVGTSLQVVACAAHDCRPLSYVWLYWIGPVFGTVSASFVFALMHPIEAVCELVPHSVLVINNDDSTTTAAGEEEKAGCTSNDTTSTGTNKGKKVAADGPVFAARPPHHFGHSPDEIFADEKDAAAAANAVYGHGSPDAFGASQSNHTVRHPLVGGYSQPESKSELSASAVAAVEMVPVASAAPAANAVVPTGAVPINAPRTAPNTFVVVADDDQAIEVVT